MLVDLVNTGITGKEMEALLEEANITCNKNTIPNDPQSPNVTSGVRLGTAAVTSRGMNTEDMDKLAEAISLVIKDADSREKAKQILQLNIRLTHSDRHKIKNIKKAYRRGMSFLLLFNKECCNIQTGRRTIYHSIQQYISGYVR